MGGRRHWIEADEAVYPVQHHAALLLELLMQQGFNSHRVLRGTGLFAEDLGNRDLYVSACQLLQLVNNARQLDSDGELAFRWGSQFWPGHYGVCSNALTLAANLEDALRLLCRFVSRLSPLMTPRLWVDSRFVYVQWIDSHGAGANADFLARAHMAGLAAMVRWLSGQTLEWQYLFAGPRPADDACHQVYLGRHCHYETGIDLMLAPVAELSRPWPRHMAVARKLAEQEALREQDNAGRDGLPASVYRYLVCHIRQPVNLPLVAEAFAMSPATFKRRLGKQGCHFQHLQDQARLHVGLYLLHIKGWNNEQVAQHLCFNDTNNFRRAFKRWCGLTPSDSRSRFDMSDLLASVQIPGL